MCGVCCVIWVWRIWCKKYCKLFFVQQNCCTLRSAEAILWVIIKYINTWFENSANFGNVRHSTRLLQRFYTRHCFNWILSLLWSPNYFTATLQLHKLNLILQHAFDNVCKADGIVDVIQVVVKKLKGYNRSKRNVILERAYSQAR